MFEHHDVKRAAALALILCGGACRAAETAEAPDTVRPPVEFAGPLREGIPSLQLSTDFGSPALGLGTYRPAGQVESRGVQIGAFTVRAAAHGGLGYTDNVGLAQTNKTSSMVFAWSPSIAVGLEGSLARYYVMYRGNYGRYSESPADDYEEHDFLLSAANSWTSRLRSLLTYEYLRGHNPRGTVIGSNVPERWALQSFRAFGSYGAEGAQGRIEADAGFNRLRFLNNELLAAAREYDSIELGGTFLYRLAPKTRALLQLRRADIEHDADPTLDNVEMQYLAGVTWEALATLVGSVRFGYMTKDFSSSARDDFSGPSYEAAVLWSPQTYSTLEFFARRAFGEAHEAGSAFVVNDVASLSWNHLWPRAVRSTATYTFGRVSQEGVGRTDKYQGLSLKVTYGFRRWLRAGAEYRHDIRDSTIEGLDYRRNLTFFTVEAAL